MIEIFGTLSIALEHIHFTVIEGLIRGQATVFGMHSNLALKDVELLSIVTVAEQFFHKRLQDELEEEEERTPVDFIRDEGDQKLAEMFSIQF